MEFKFVDENYKIIEPWCLKLSFNVVLNQYLEWDYQMVKRNIVNLYKNHTSMKTYFCFYCGEYGESKDHVPAVYYTNNDEHIERFLVRSCIPCNCAVSNKPFHTLQSRCQYLIEWYTRKYKKLLDSPIWTENEIDELKGSLKSKIVIMMKNKKYIESKIKHLSNNVELLMGNMRIDQDA